MEKIVVHYPTYYSGFFYTGVGLGTLHTYSGMNLQKTST